MGASAREIEQEIKETRGRMDQNLGVLEDRATSGAQRYGKVAAALAVTVAASAVGLIVWRRVHRPSMQERLAGSRHRLARLKAPMPSVKVVVGEREEPGMLGNIVRKVAPAVVGTAAASLVERMARPPETEPE